MKDVVRGIFQFGRGQVPIEGVVHIGQQNVCAIAQLLVNVPPPTGKDVTTVNVHFVPKVRQIAFGSTNVLDSVSTIGQVPFRVAVHSNDGVSLVPQGCQSIVPFDGRFAVNVIHGSNDLGRALLLRLI